MGYMVSHSGAGVEVIECDTCNDTCPVTVHVDGKQVKSFKAGELALQNATRYADEIIIRRIHVEDWKG
ncbi:hypothetical protein UFOVP965_108 [uncultured Caudovirales phage]|uniref:Uncharacterized protein n=1 Tax=uncultured Caudovirales phage TaxID=2100421 RepID=A0A6J5Q650_9CAUD|nr:hypothetical protein UFOVP965_108 [uncultured Caudovirales phage]CAB4179897.1 hypothetical protein UFOVP1035_104 [uncultured Caudovirales phage]CAB4188716.1 hypothetical protein UFOVP1181_63 [uncultured Caudovirales phage]